MTNWSFDPKLSGAGKYYFGYRDDPLLEYGYFDAKHLFGLSGMFLLNGFEISEHDGEEHYSVKDFDGLAEVVANVLFS